MDLQPPGAPKKYLELAKHGDVRVDPWFWLRDREDPDTLEYLRSENAYAEAAMKSTEDLRETLLTEMRARIKEDDSGVAEKDGDYYYYTRFEEGSEYPLYGRRYLAPDAPEEVLLDANLLARGQNFFRIGVFRNSPDHRWLAYSVNTDGSETYTIHIVNLVTGEKLPETIPNTYYSLEWANDSQNFFYNILDESHRPAAILRHHLGEDPAADPVVRQESDPGLYLRVIRSASGRFLFLVARGNNRSEWWYIAADQPASEPVLIAPRRDGLEYDVTDHGHRFLILHNGDGAYDFQISATPVPSPGPENWRDFLAHQPGRPLREMQAFRDHLSIAYREEGLPQLRVINMNSGQAHTIGFAEEDYFVRLQPGREWDTSVLRFVYSSMTTPPTVFDYDMNTRERKLVHRTAVLGGFDSGNYVTRRLWAPGQDGSQIPVTVLHRKGQALDGSSPLHLSGYGSYGGAMEAVFNINRLALLDRGFVFAIAHLRGGMEMGWDWYARGKLLEKKNTFTDFIDCAEHLVRRGYTSAGNIVAEGGSAGGLVMGVVANWRPELFKAIIARVPFVDVLNTMLDHTLPMISLEYSEWGNPNHREYYDYIKSYSPYDNVQAQDYPHMYITGGLNDTRTTYWEPAKWAARLRDSKTDQNLLLLRIDFEAGHGGASGRFDRLKEVALEYAFILKAFGMDGTAAPSGP
jgi:oligopeptidase B